MSPDITIVHGEARDALAAMADNSITAVVTDAPYGLSDLPSSKVTEALTRWLGDDPWFTPKGKGLVGKDWDAFVPPPGLWAEVLRVLAPGGYALVFCSVRTLDLMAMSMRLAGFDIRDTITTLQAQSMPKSLNVAKAMRAKGLPGADDWEGWGTNLRVSNEPVIVARKPLSGTVAANVARWGAGALNIDATRVPHLSEADAASAKPQGRATFRPGSFVVKGTPRVEGTYEQSGLGRWPADVVLVHSPDCTHLGSKEVASNSHHPASRGPGGVTTSGHGGQDDLVERRSGTEVVPDWDCAPGCPVAELDRLSGNRPSGANPTYRSGGKSVSMAGAMPAGPITPHRGADTGGASRFFPTFGYFSKAKGSEKPKVDGIEHESVKSLPLMRWLVRLVGRPGDGALLLDPFAGSGTTLEACLLEGINCIGIERESDYIRLIEARLDRHGR